MLPKQVQIKLMNRLNHSTDLWQSVFIIACILSSCTNSTKKNVAEKDSVFITSADSITERSSDFSLTVTDTTVILIASGGQEGAKQLFSEIYPEATIIQLDSPDSIAAFTPDITILSWEFEEEVDLFSTTNECLPFKILKVISESNDGEQAEWRVVQTNEDRVREFSFPISFDITERQNLSTVTMSFNSELVDGCTVVAIEETYEGGDIGYGWSNSITFYKVDNTGFTEIIKIDLLSKETDYEDKIITNTISEYQIMESLTNGLHDVEITSSVLDSINQAVESKTEICKWSGSEYECNAKQD